MNNYIKLFSALSLTSALIPMAAQAATKSEKPNILIIFTDDHRYDSVHALGSADGVNGANTPNLDKIINSGVSFNNAYLQGANTGATSTASRAQLLTGRGVFDIPNGNGTPWGPEISSFPVAFRDAGYETFITGKSHNGTDASTRGFTTGDKMYGLINGYYTPHFRLPCVDYRADQKYHENDAYYVYDNGAKQVLVKEALDSFNGDHSTDVFGRAAVNFIEEYNEDKPFLMYVAFHAPHDVRNFPEEYRSMYDAKDIPLPSNFLEGHPFDNGAMYIRDECTAPFPRTAQNTKEQIANYYRMISHVDDYVGKMMDALKAKGMDENTIVVFSSDSGLAMGSHGLFGKQNLYDDGGIRVPMVFSGAGLPQGKRPNDLCYSADIFPTLCGLVGIDVPESCTGLNQAASVKGRSQYLRKEAYFAYMDIHRAIRNDRYKLIEYCVEGERHTQLFDLQEDRYECNDLSKNPAYADIVKSLRKSLVSHSVEEIGNVWGAEFWNTYMDSYDPDKL
ncbi:MAG: sulfatase-like hydrolase/transferase [Rikenellaceae bacterium]